jgi:hypothetical protein
LRYPTKRLGTKEAEMKIVGCDLHARQQTLAMMDTETGEYTEKTLVHEGNAVREFYAGLEGPVLVGIEATGAMQWFLELLEELGIEYRVGPPSKDSSPRNPEAEARPARRRFVINVAARGSLPRKLDALERTARPTDLATGP